MIAIGNGEACPFCKDDDKFIMEQGKDLLDHLFKEHPEEAEKALFGGDNVGI